MMVRLATIPFTQDRPEFISLPLGTVTGSGSDCVHEQGLQGLDPKGS